MGPAALRRPAIRRKSVEEGVYLNNLDPGAVLDVETTGCHYTIKYVDGDENPDLGPSQLVSLAGSRPRSA
jgi:hypothetical protein